MALRLAEQHLSGRAAVRLILDYAAYADAEEVPGLVAALRCLLHGDELDAATVVEARRRQVTLQGLRDQAAAVARATGAWSSGRPPTRPERTV